MTTLIGTRCKRREALSRGVLMRRESASVWLECRIGVPLLWRLRVVLLGRECRVGKVGGLARWVHPIPFRTRPLSTVAAMVLPKGGRVASRQPYQQDRQNTHQRRTPLRSAALVCVCPTALQQGCAIVSAMSVWARQRQIAYAALVGGVLLAPVLLYGLHWYFSLPETCSDGKQNQGETGVDCGGPCPLACPFEVAPYSLQWVRVAPVAPGRYHVVAYFENSNRGRFASEIPYVVTLYDEANEILAQANGVFTLLPQPIVAVIHTNLTTGSSVATKATFTYARPTRWYQFFDEYLLPEVHEETIVSSTPRPRAEAILENPHPDPLTGIEAVGLIYDATGNLVAASRTVVERLEPHERKRIVFTWPAPWQGDGVRLEVVVSRPSLFRPLPHVRSAP